ncbi:uncharacterized protein PG998_005752 [Apiospora kogelbergensis]|uniref:uncharacterized protein n=1 Tax=Apiospora kogelbergensis TaxID=1337665 RepID=UPI00312CC5B3
MATLPSTPAGGGSTMCWYKCARGHTPAYHLRCKGLVFLRCAERVREPANVLLNPLQVLTKFYPKSGMEAFVEDLVHHPSNDDSPSDSRHFLLAGLDRLGADILLDPAGHRLPVFTNVEREVVNCAVQAVKPGLVLIVVKRCAGLRNTLVGHSILKLLHLAIELIYL